MRNRIYVVLCLFLLTQCRSSAPSEDVSCTIRPLALTEVTDIAPYVDSVRVVALETAPGSLLTTFQKVLVTPSGNFIVLDTKGIYAFSPQGKFLFPIGRRGKGPGEYLQPLDICLSGDGKELLVLEGSNRISIFDPENGKFRKALVPEWREGRQAGDAICPDAEGGFYIVTSNPTELDRFDPPYYCLHRFDREGRETESLLPRKDFVFTMGLVTQTDGNRYLLRPQEGDDVCHELGGKELKRKYRFDFGDRAVPLHYIFDRNGAPDMGKYMSSPYYKLPIYIYDNDDLVVFTAVGPGVSSNLFVYSKEDRNGIRMQTEPGDPAPFDFVAAGDGYFYGQFGFYGAPGGETVARMPPLKRHPIRTHGLRLEEGENPRLVGIKFRL